MKTLKFLLIFVLCFFIISGIKSDVKALENNKKINAKPISVYYSVKNDLNGFSTKLSTDKTYRNDVDIYNYVYCYYHNNIAMHSSGLLYLMNLNYKHSGVICFNFNDEFG